MKIHITMDVDEEYADPDHEFGVTEEAYVDIISALSAFGDDIEVHRT